MNKYFVIFRIPLESIAEWTKSVSEDERKKQSEQMMQDWKTWMDKHQSAIVENGWPLGKTKRVTKDGVEDARNDLNYGLIIQAPTHDEAVQIIADNPHLNIPTSFVDVMEIPHMGL